VSVVRKAGTALRLVREQGSALRRRRAIARSVPTVGSVHVYYGVDPLPTAGEPLAGGLVKAQRLAATLPNSLRSFNVLYLVSSARPLDGDALIALARRRNAAFVWNQNGVAYPAWHGPGWEQTNAPLSRGLHAADHVFFQSEFCRLASDRYLGVREGPAEVLYNAVDTTAFTPAVDARRPLTLLLGGNQYAWYRVDAAVRTLAHVRGHHADARLVVTGVLGHDDATGRRRLAALAATLGVADAVDAVGMFTQDRAADIYRSCDVLVHTQYNDACPGVVIEALSSGLPVAYSASGGVPELVGPDAGIGVPAPLDFEVEHPPDPESMAEAVVRLAEDLEGRREAARARAVARFDIRPWIERHAEVFARLVE
jgi:glycosyltransferase involved in cell wall biosynthesis